MNLKKFILLLPMFLLLLGCPNDDDMFTPEETELENVTYEVILFEFTPDTGNNTSRLRYEIKFSNPNDFAINGFHKITINADGIISSNIATDSSPCYLIGANSDCTINFDEEDSFDIGMVNSIELVSVEYNFEN
ncbi:hypothetical protein [Olleya aquimaris]|uniref:Uncharacterized protein n=1 Tax=Olleya aquimaris TaxID=639310 RepID=A0A327RBX0_9FLAO|nr:hypothetical protein [Olleya aquimaris]RAJ12973.1 hypothetical protein LY08_02255 [Olleya aquimaris]